MRGPALDLKSTILARMDAKSPFGVWTPVDFIDAGSRTAVDQALHRLVKDKVIRRLARGLYDKPRLNSLTKQMSPPDPKAVIDALGRRDNSRMLVDGLTAANDLGLSDAVPAKILVHTDARLTPFDLGGVHIDFKKTAPSKLFWAGRPAMRVVQALHWLQDQLPVDGERIRKRLQAILQGPDGAAIVKDLQDNRAALPSWMGDFLQDVEVVKAYIVPLYERPRPSPR
jgi:endo-beta-N-acetylglucosaminidase D